MITQLSVTQDELVNLLKQKSRQAFEMLYNCYYAALYGSICRVVKDTAAAEDLLQDTFMKIWIKIALYDPAKGSLYTWMLNIANNTCIDFLRSKYQTQKIKNAGDEYNECEEVLSLCDSSWYLVKNELQFFTRKIEAKYSKIIEMTYFMGYTQEEAAIILGIPVGTVKTRSLAGIKKLRKLYF